MIIAKAVMDSLLLEHAADVESLAVLSRFRMDFHACLAGCDGRLRPCRCRGPRTGG